jgi:hypothetical protein
LEEAATTSPSSTNNEQDRGASITVRTISQSVPYFGVAMVGGGVGGSETESENDKE